MESDLETRERKETDQERGGGQKEGNGGFLPSWAPPAAPPGSPF